MSATTFTQAQDKGLRHQLDGLRRFAAGLYAAHGGWLKPDALQRQLSGQRKVLELAKHVETYSPSLATELRNIASRG